MTDEQFRNNQAQLLAWRFILAALRYDEDAYSTAWNDFQTIRESDFQASGRSAIVSRLVRLLAYNAAGSLFDAEEAHGGDRNRAERWLENQIRELLDEADA